MTKLEPQDPAPDFDLPTDLDRNVRLADFAGSTVIVYFYPAAMTPGCTTEAIDFSAASTELNKSGYHLVGISPDSVEKLKEFAAKDSVTFPLASDPDHKVMEAYGAYGKKVLYGKEIEGVIRSTFVIDVDQSGKGTVRLAQYNVKATGHVGRLLDQLGLAPAK